MYENAVKMTPEQVEEYSQNLFFNYYILNQTLRAFGLKKKIVGKTAVGHDSTNNVIHYEIGESANEFVSVLIDEAIGGKFDLEHESGKVKKTVVKRGTLMDRLYVKVGDDYLDVHRPAQNENELSADEVIEQMVELFGFDEDIWFGKKRMNLGITLPDAIKDDKARLIAKPRISAPNQPNETKQNNQRQIYEKKPAQQRQIVHQQPESRPRKILCKT